MTTRHSRVQPTLPSRQAEAELTEKKHSVRGGASPERTISHTTDNITYKEVITNEN